MDVVFRNPTAPRANGTNCRRPLPRISAVKARSAAEPVRADPSKRKARRPMETPSHRNKGTNSDTWRIGEPVVPKNGIAREITSVAAKSPSGTRRTRPSARLPFDAFYDRDLYMPKLPRSTWLKWILIVGLTVGCRRTPVQKESGSSSAPASGASADWKPRSTADATMAISDAIALADLRVEGIRGVASASDALLGRHRARLDAHFGGSAPFPLAFQVVAVEGGKGAVLLQATSGEPLPLVWLLDSRGEIVWTKEHPNGGAPPGASELVVTPGPDGHVCVAWCSGATNSVAFRRWAEDGSSFADYDALHVDDCDALTVLYWPRRGWILAVADDKGATLELIDENGERKWGANGLALPWTWDGAAPVSLALDTLDTFMLFRLGRSGGAGSSEYLFASRWSADGRPLWPGPSSLKRLPAKISDRRARVVLRPAAEGAIRATVNDAVVEVLSDGTVTHR